MNQTELQPFLQSDDIFCADRVRAPQTLVEVFAIPPSELVSGMENKVERAERFDDPFNLTEFPDVAARISRSIHVRPKRKPYFILSMRPVAGYDQSPSTPQFGNQTGADRSISTCHQNSFLHL